MDEIALVTWSGLPQGDLDDQPLFAALKAHGLKATPVAWDAPVDWSRFRAAVIRSTWDYVARREELVAWAARAGERTRLFNPPEVIRWNTDKRYLRELEAARIPVVPTEWIDPGETPRLGRRLAARGWSQAVIKPAIGAGGLSALKVDASSPEGLTLGEEHLTRLLDAGRPCLLQPFLPEILTSGERSLVFIAGELSHAARKRPAFSAHTAVESAKTSIEGTAALEEAEGVVIPFGEGEAGAARAALAAAPGPTLYARVDLLQTGGVWRLMELELTEPTLFLRGHPQAADRLAEEILRRS